jgi:hypothetical protein
MKNNKEDSIDEEVDDIDADDDFRTHLLHPAQETVKVITEYKGLLK